MGDVATVSRRDQIVAATIEVIASSGYPQASFARIAEQGGLSSTRLISYHFAGKADLMAAVADHVIAAMGAVVHERVSGESTARGRLRAYIGGVVAFTATHRAAMAALLEIFLNGALDHDAETDAVAAGHVEAIVAEGVAAGEFRHCDARVVGSTVQRAVEALPFLLAATPDLDCDAYARELVELFDRGLRPDRP